MVSVNKIKAKIRIRRGDPPGYVYVDVSGSANGIALKGRVGPFNLALDPADLRIVEQTTGRRVNFVSHTRNGEPSFSAMRFVHSAIMNALEAHSY